MNIFFVKCLVKPSGCGFFSLGKIFTTNGFFSLGKIFTTNLISLINMGFMLVIC